jgi:hypothetical protein
MLTDPATFGRLILSFHKLCSLPGATRAPSTNSGKIPKIGTREHISELLSVKDSGTEVVT